MQRADTQNPLRCSPPASSEAQPDHRRKVVQKVGSQRHSQWHRAARKGTTDRVRDSGRGETNDELRRLGSTRGKMPKIKTHSVLAVVKGHERGNKVFGERFMNSIRSDCKDAIANNFLGVGVDIIQVEGLSNLGGRSLDNVVIVWWQSGSGRFAGFRVQNPRLFRGSGGRRRKESKKISSNCFDLSRKKRLTNFRIEGAEDLWSLEDRKMLSAEVWESEGSVGNHPIKRVKSRALKNVGREHFVEAKLVENGGGT